MDHGTVVHVEFAQVRKLNLPHSRHLGTLKQQAAEHRADATERRT